MKCPDCGKQSYKTKGHAIGAALNRMRPGKNESPVSLRTYRCPEGRGYHLTSTRKRTR